MKYNSYTAPVKDPRVPLVRRATSQEKARARQIATRVLGALGATAAIGLAINSLEQNPIGKKNESTEAAWFESLMKQEAPLRVGDKHTVVVVKEGAKIRSTPDTYNGDPSLGASGNVEARVSKDRVLVIANPLQYMDDNGNTWYGFMNDADNNGIELPDEPTAEAVAKKYSWVNATQLGDEYVRVYEDPRSTPERLVPAINNYGQITVNGSHQVALGGEMPMGAINMVARGLEPRPTIEDK